MSKETVKATKTTTKTKPRTARTARKTNPEGIFHATIGQAAKTWIYSQAKKKGISGNDMMKLLVENARKKKLLS